MRLQMDTGNTGVPGDHHISRLVKLMLSGDVVDQLIMLVVMVLIKLMIMLLVMLFIKLLIMLLVMPDN